MDCSGWGDGVAFDEAYCCSDQAGGDSVVIWSKMDPTVGSDERPEFGGALFVARFHD